MRRGKSTTLPASAALPLGFIRKHPNFVVTNSFVGQPSGQLSLKDGDSTQISQEFQLNGDLLSDSLHYTAGFYYMNDETDTGNLANWNGVNGVWGASGGDVPDGLVAALSNYSQTGQTNKNDSYSVYTQWSWDFTEQLELTAGLRYGYEQRDVKSTPARFNTPLGSLRGRAWRADCSWDLQR